MLSKSYWKNLSLILCCSIVALSCLLPASSHAAVVVANHSSSSTGTTESNSLSWSLNIDPSGVNRYLAVGVTILRSASLQIPPQVASVTWENDLGTLQNLQLLKDENSDTNQHRVEIWGRIAPFPGQTGNGTVTVTFATGETAAFIAGALSLTGVDQLEPIYAATSAFNQRPSSMVADTVQALDGYLVFDVLGVDGDLAPVNDSEQTSRWNSTTGAAIGDLRAAASTEFDPDFGELALISWDIAVKRYWVLAGVTIRPGPVFIDEMCCSGAGEKLQAIPMLYTGDDCSASDNTQGDQFSCTDYAPMPDVVKIIVTDKPDPNHKRAKRWFEGYVGLFESFMIDSMNEGLSQISGDSYIFIYDINDNLVQQMGFHTSCSNTLSIGDVFGSLLCLGCVPEGDGDPNLCSQGGLPQTMQMEFTGENCSASNNSQGPRGGCIDYGPLPSQVQILVTDSKIDTDPAARVWFDGLVSLNGNFLIDANNAGASILGSDTFLFIYDASGNTMLQQLRIRTSCSRPLILGDQFGSLVLLALTLL